MMQKCISAAYNVLFLHPSEHIGRSNLPSHAHAAMCGDLVNLGLSTTAKMKKSFYLATLHVGAQMGFAFLQYQQHWQGGKDTQIHQLCTIP